MDNRKPISAIVDKTIGVQSGNNRSALSGIVDKYIQAPIQPSQGLVGEAPLPKNENAGFASGFESALRNQPVMYGQGMQAYGDVTGIDAISNVGKKVEEAQGKPETRPLTWDDIEEPRDAVNWLLERAGEDAGSMATSMAAGLAGTGIGAATGLAFGGAPGAATGAVIGGLTVSGVDAVTANTGELRQALIQEGVDPDTASAYAVPFGSILSIPDIAVMGKVLSKFGIGTAAKDEARAKVIQHIRNEIAKKNYKGAGKSLIRQTGKDIADIAPIEAATEFGQTLGQQGVVSYAADKPFFSPENTEEAVSATVSGLFGGTFGGAGGATVNTAFTKPTIAPKDRVTPTMTAPGADGQTSQDGAEAQQPAPETKSPPNRDSLAAAMETPKAQQTPPPVTAVQPNPNPTASPPAAALSQGDVVEHVTPFGEIIEGTIDSVQETPEQGRSFQIVDKFGEIHTIFDGEGQTSVINPAQPPIIPTRDDLAARMDGTYVEPTPTPAPVALLPEPVSAPPAPLSFKDRLPQMSDEDLMAAYRGKNVRDRNLAEQEIESRYPGFGVTKTLDIEDQAAQVAPEPTDAQKEAGNYKKGHINLNGLDITLENAKGGKRRGTGPDGTAWEVDMPSHYGYIKRTTGADGDNLDVYVGDNPTSDKVFVVDQIDADTQAFDEHKAMIGFTDIQQAMATYEQAFSDGKAERRVGGVTIMSTDEFKTWLKKENTKKPLQYVQPPEGQDFKPASTPEVDIPFDQNPANPAETVETKPNTVSDIPNSATETEKPETPPTPRAAKMQDVGEKMDGKRAFQDRMDKKPLSEQAKEIIDSTKKSVAFDFAKSENQTDGLARFGQELVSAFDDFSAHLRSKNIIQTSGRGRYSTKYFGWEQQVSAFFKEISGNEIQIGERAYVDQYTALERRAEILTRANDYVSLGSQLTDAFKNSKDIAEFKLEFKTLLDDPEFLAIFNMFSKRRNLKYDVFSQERYSVFGPITDITELKKPNRVENTLTRPKLEIIERKDLKDYRNGKDITAEQFKDEFGFRGVEFGEWVNAKEGQQHVNHAFDALHDLADRLGIKPTYISLGGKLGFAFGSRGSGEHAAHYEPATNVINLTKTKGDGSVAHEWLHALDHNLRSDRASSQIMDMAYATLKTKLRDESHIEKTLKDFLGSKIWYDRNKSAGPIGNAKQYLTYIIRNPLRQLGQTTQFKIEADALGKTYWGTGKELLARAWESFIYDTIEGKSPYLVNDWVADGAVTKETGYRGTPYPTGDERVAFNKFFDDFIKLIEFSDDGVKFKEGAKLPLQDEIQAISKIAESYQPKLADMMEEITNGSIQQATVSPSVPESNVGESAEDVSESGYDADIERLFGRDRGGSTTDVRGERGAAESAGNEGRSEKRGDGDSVRPDDTIPDGVEDAIPDFQAKGTNHKIPFGALDEKRGQKQKAKDNLEIIAVVKKIEREARAATPEEQTLLAKYTGWGSIKNSFPNAEGKPNDGWSDIVAQVKEALTEKEYREARRSIQYAHYTSEIVVRSMWDAISRFGLDKGSIFEPGMGIGNFVGMIPDSIKAEYSGLEIDTMTARIGRILYPESSVRHADFTSARYADGMFDAVIGNPPFSNTTINSDPKYRKDKLSVHNYFFAKSIDMVAPGGIVAFVTSRFSMDAQDSAARKLFAEKVDLVGSIRLPDTAFKTNAHTEVVTDIIFLRKRLQGEESNGVKWMDTKTIEFMGKDGNTQQHHVNEYFHNNPEMVLGNYAQGSMYSAESMTVEPVENSDLTAQLAEAVGRLPEKIITDIQKANTEAMDLQPTEKKEGSYYVKNGTLMQVDGGIGIAIQMRGKGVAGGMSKADHDKIVALIPVRNSLRETMAAMVSRDESGMKAAQKALKKAHSAFVKKYGPVTKSETESRPPTPAQLEEARDELRNDYDAADEEFDEGDIDLSRLLNRVNPETNKKYTPAQIGRIRQQRREEIEAKGGIVNEGSFDASTVPDNITIKYPNLDGFKADPEYYNLMILENYNQDTGEATTTEVFDKNIVAEVKTPEIKTAVDALNYSLATKNGIAIDMMARALNKNAESIVDELEELDLIYSLPDQSGNETYVYSEEYLSGYVKDKLAYAKTIAKMNKKYERNVLALEAVQPRDIPASDINTRLGSPYFDTEVIRDFMRDELKISATVNYTPILNSWDVDAHDPRSPENITMYGTADRPASVLMESLLSKKDIRVTVKGPDDKQIVDVAATQAAQDKAKELQDKFSEWIWKSSHSERVYRAYNDQFNNIVARKFDGSHITTAISPSITLRPHQKSAVWRILQTGNTYLAHAVGAGKTLEMATAAMEMRRLGIWKKPMQVVPNHMLSQFAAEFRAAYPQAKIFVADENNFHTDRRKRFVANVAKGDWDCVVITFSAFKKIPISDDFEAGMLETQLEQYRAALTEISAKKATRSTASRLEKQIEKMESRLKSLRVKDKDQSFSFEELGVDAIMLDEAHYYRKLSFPTMQGTMKGVNPIGSKAAWDLYVKSKYLDTIHPGRSLVMASGTPLTNTLAEVFTIQRYMNERALEKRGINNFDSWSSVYANSVSNPERQPSGAYKVVTRLAEFMNLGSLSQMVREFMDTVTSDELGALVDRPVLKTGTMIIKTVEPSIEYLSFQKYLAERTKEVAKNSRKNEKGADNILAIIGEGRHAAIDMRLIDPTLPEGESKLEDMIQTITDIYKETKNDEFKKKYRGDDTISPIKGGTQLVFSDLGVRTRIKDGKTFSAYDHIKRKLIRNGVPAAHIAFIADYDTTEDKRRLQKMVNDGEIRIVIGSTAKMGTGLNVQNRLKAVHNLDAPWLPADLEQRTGRALRQGNQYKEIEIYGYGTEGSYDSTMWGMLETKAKAIIQFLKGDTDLTSMRDIEETDHFRMAKAMTSGDARVLKQAELQSEVDKLARQSKNFRNEQVNIRSGIASRKNGTESAKENIKNTKDAISKRKPVKEDEFLMTVLGKPFAERAEASDAMTKAVTDAINSNIDTTSKGIKIGELQGFDIKLFIGNNSNLSYSYQVFLDHPALVNDGKEWESGSKGFSGSGTITTLTNALNRLEKRISTYEYTIEANTREIKVLESQITDKFPKEEELIQKRQKLEEIEKDLRENAPIEITYGEYPISYWEQNKDAMNSMFSLRQEDEFYYDPVAKSGRATLTLKAPVKREAIQAKLNEHLKKIGFPAANVVLYDPAVDMPNMANIDSRVQGAHLNGIVYISMNAEDVIGTLNHEIVHALKQSGAFTETEWKILTIYSKTWRRKYDIDNRYKRLELTDAQLDEEGVAHAMQDQALKGPAQRFRNKIVKFFRDIKAFLIGKPYEFKNVDDIKNAILSGDISGRKKAKDFLKANKDNKIDTKPMESAPMFSLPSDKKEALKSAIAAIGNNSEPELDLSHVEGIDSQFRPAIGKIASFILHPHQIASLYKSFTPVYRNALDMMKMRDVIVHDLTNHLDIYNKIGAKSKKKIDAVLEIGRLTKQNFVLGEDGTIKTKNIGIESARHSAVGDEIILNEMEAKGYLGVRQAMNKALETYKQTILQEYGFIDQGIENQSDLSKAISKEKDPQKIAHMQEALRMLQDIEDAKRHGYIPFKRWGDVGITIRKKSEEKDGESELIWFERVELPKRRKNTIGENKAVKERLAALTEKYPGTEFEIETFEVKDFSTLQSKLTLNELDILAASSDMTEQDYAVMRGMLEDAIKRRGFRSHFFKSKDVPGYSEDFERAINDYVVSVAGHLSRRTYQPKLDKAVSAIEKAGEASLFEYARKYVTYISDPQEELAAIRQMGFIWYLAGNLASGATNLMQPFMVSAPWFKSMFSHADIAKQMAKAYADTMKMASFTEGTGVFDFDKAPADVKNALNKASAEGEFIPLNTFDSMAIATTNSAYLRGLDRQARAAQDVLSLTFSIPERTNRIVTYITAYRFAIDPKNKKQIMSFMGRDQMARQSLVGKSEAEFAEAFADYATISTQFRMGKVNRPSMGRGYGVLPTQFMGYVLQSFELMYRLTKINGAKSGSAVGVMLLTVVAMSGVFGFPYMDDLKDLFESAWKKLTRTDLDIESEMRKFLTEHVGQTMSDAIVKGIPYALLNVDMSGRLGFGNIVPDGQDDFLGIWFDMLVVKPGMALEAGVKGDYVQAMAYLSPAFIKNPLQAYLWSVEGVRSQSTGLPIIAKEDLTGADIGLKMFGFTSSDVSAERARIYAEQRASNAANDLRNDYYSRLSRTIYAMNNVYMTDKVAAAEYEAEIQAIFAEIARHNENAPLHKQVIINKRTLIERVKKETMGAGAKKIRKQAREEAEALDKAYGK